MDFIQEYGRLMTRTKLTRKRHCRSVKEVFKGFFLIEGFQTKKEDEIFWEEKNVEQLSSLRQNNQQLSTPTSIVNQQKRCLSPNRSDCAAQFQPQNN